MDLSHFWELASPQTTTREKACKQLINQLISVQNTFASNLPVTDKCVDVNAEQNDLASRYHSDVIYTLNRLVRGLSSSRGGAREGFSLALTEVLRFILAGDVSLESLVHLIITENSGSGALKGPEERDMLFGRIFGLMALVDSVDLTDNFQCSSLDIIVSELLKCADKPYTRECCFEILAKLTLKVFLTNIRSWFV